MEQFPQKKLERLLTIVSELCTLLNQENRLLKQQKQSECKNLLEQKAKLSAAYEESFSYFSKNPEILKTLPEKQKSVLKKAATTLENLTQENGRMLKINIEATSRLLNAIIEDVNEQKHAKAPLYTRKGSIETDTGNPAAISFNQVL